MEAGRPTWNSGIRSAAPAVLAVLALSLLTVGGGGPATVVVPVAIAGLAIGGSVWVLLHTRRQRQAYEQRLTAWAGERAAQAERLRIARDLHDLASHGLGLITVRAAVARAVGPGNLTEQAAALTDIERVSRETTTELRRMLTVLRTPSSDPAPFQPSETLDALPAIVQAARDAGLRVTLDELPDPDDVSLGAQLTVCAIVREALRNTLRHAGPTRARVSVHRHDGTLVTTVRDDGPAGTWDAQPGAGHGLAGLHERVTALGGVLHAAPDDPGFVLTAHIPDGPTG